MPWRAHGPTCGTHWYAQCRVRTATTPNAGSASRWSLRWTGRPSTRCKPRRRCPILAGRFRPNAHTSGPEASPTGHAVTRILLQTCRLILDGLDRIGRNLATGASPARRGGVPEPRQGRPPGRRGSKSRCAGQSSHRTDARHELRPGSVSGRDARATGLAVERAVQRRHRTGLLSCCGHRCVCCETGLPVGAIASQARPTPDPEHQRGARATARHLRLRW